HHLAAAAALRFHSLVAVGQQDGFIEGEAHLVLALHGKDRLAVARRVRRQGFGGRGGAAREQGQERELEQGFSFHGIVLLCRCRDADGQSSTDRLTARLRPGEVKRSSGPVVAMASGRSPAAQYLRSAMLRTPACSCRPGAKSQCPYRSSTP